MAWGGFFNALQVICVRNRDRFEILIPNQDHLPYHWYHLNGANEDLVSSFIYEIFGVTGDMAFSSSSYYVIPVGRSLTFWE